MASDNKQSFGIFKPVGDVVISFPSADQADAAARALAAAGVATTDVRRMSDREMLDHADRNMESASGLAANVGQELNVVKGHRKLAQKGYHWLIVHAPDTRQAQRVSEIAQAHGAERAQRYGTFIIEEMIDRPGDLPQVAESPDRGLDAQTPSVSESEAQAMRGNVSLDRSNRR